MEKVPKKRRNVKDSGQAEIQEDSLEGEIIDLVDLAEEYLETVETNLDLSSIDTSDLDDTLDEELMDINAGDNRGTSAREDKRHPDFEKALLELFESSESAAAKLLKEEFPKDQSNEESVEADDHLKGGGVAYNKPRTQATDGKDGTGGIPDPKKEFPKNLFLNLEVVEETPRREPGVNQAVPLDVEQKVAADKTNWLESGRYYPEYVQTIDLKIAEYEKEIERLVDKKRKIKKTYEQLRSILYLEGEQLKKAVAIILSRYWSLKLAFMNKEKRAGFNENILIKHNDRIVIAKIKGTHDASPSHKFITQLWQDLHYSGLGTRADGALIVNHDIENDPEVRGIPYADEDGEELNDLILIDTRTLHKLTTAIIDGDLSVEEASKILFKKGRVEFKQSVI
jgi:DNA-dependent RNA polymerase auxiliary subunit epsilon